MLGRRRAKDPALFRALLAFAASTLVLVATITKTGTYLNTIALAESPLIALAAAGFVWLLAEAPRRRGALAAAGLAVALGISQVVGFVVSRPIPGSSGVRSRIGDTTGPAGTRRRRRWPRLAAVPSEFPSPGSPTSPSSPTAACPMTNPTSSW